MVFYVFFASQVGHMSLSHSPSCEVWNLPGLQLRRPSMVHHTPPITKDPGLSGWLVVGQKTRGRPGNPKNSPVSPVSTTRLQFFFAMPQAFWRSSSPWEFGWRSMRSTEPLLVRMVHFLGQEMHHLWCGWTGRGRTQNHQFFDTKKIHGHMVLN